MLRLGEYHYRCALFWADLRLPQSILPNARSSKETPLFVHGIIHFFHELDTRFCGVNLIHEMNEFLSTSCAHVATNQIWGW